MASDQTSATAEIIKRITGATEIKETHISQVIMTDEYVYKIKKSVDFGFLDFKLPKSRRAYCILELELNNRFSDGIYLEVMKLVRRSADTFALVPVESSLIAMEYVLKMKRIKDEDFLSERISKNLITQNDMVNIGAETAKLLQKLEPAPENEETGTFYNNIKFNAEENFDQTLKYKGTLIDSDTYDFIKEKSLDFIARHKDDFNNRSQGGFVKNGHGDLRLEHIYFNKDGSVGLIDCIEFNKRFRYMDSVAEAAFLSMELDSSGNIPMSDSFLEGFFSVFNDKLSPKLLNYYRSYLAYVRAKVTCFLIDGKDESWELYESKIGEVKRLIDMSAYYALNMATLNTPLFYGIMGTGKSKNGKIFSSRFPVCRINSDEARKVAAGVPITEKMYLDYGKGVYSKENSLEVYRNMAKLVENKSKVSRPCLVDASFIDSDYLETFKSFNVGTLRYFQFTAPDEVIMERLKERLEKDVVSDGRPAIYYKQKESAVMPTYELLVDTTGPVNDNIERIFKTLIK